MPLPAAPSSPHFQSVRRYAQLLAWVYRQGGGPLELYVAGPNGENARKLPFPPEAFVGDLHAEGSRLVFSAFDDIYLYDATTGETRNLTNDRFAQWGPWISGNRVAYIDQKDNPRGTLLLPDNPEVYVLDLDTGVRRRITVDPPERPVLQNGVAIAGDWVVWWDPRNAPNPNPGDYRAARAEVFAYNLRSNREYPLVTGDISIGHPAILGDQVYVDCTRSGTTRTGLGIVRVPFPSP